MHEATLAALPADPDLFYRGEKLMVVVGEPDGLIEPGIAADGSPKIIPLSESNLSHRPMGRSRWAFLTHLGPDIFDSPRIDESRYSPGRPPFVA